LHIVGYLRYLAGRCSRPQERASFYAYHPAGITADSAASLLSFAVAGAGIMILSAWLVQNKITKGELIHLLSDHHFLRQGIYALCPDTRHVPEKVGAFIDFLHDRLAL